MARFKQIWTWILIIILFMIFSNYMIKVGLKNTYKSIKGEIKTASPEITINEAKTTDVNGYVNGIVSNNSEEDINKKYLKIDLFSKNDVLLGTEYFEINNLKAYDKVEFEVKYRVSNVKRFELTCIDEK